MKRNIALCLLVMIIFSGCGKKEVINFNQRSAIIEKKDGWVYLYYIEFDKSNNEAIENPSYFFGGYNLKHKELDSYKMLIINEETGETDGEAIPSVPALLYNKDYVEELDHINDLLAEKKFTDTITEKELDIELKNFKKQDIVKLHNEAIQQENAKEGNYVALPEADVVQENSIIDGYMWQIGYINMYGNIKKADIELIYADGTYLSDKVQEGTATEEEKATYAEMKSLEKSIIDFQDFDQEVNQLTSNNDMDWKRLNNLLKTLNE